MITVPERYTQTDRQTDGQTTCDRNTALCTKVHRAVKTVTSVFNSNVITHLQKKYLNTLTGLNVNINAIFALFVVYVTIYAAKTNSVHGLSIYRPIVVTVQVVR